MPGEDGFAVVEFAALQLELPGLAGEQKVQPVLRVFENAAVGLTADDGRHVVSHPGHRCGETDGIAVAHQVGEIALGFVIFDEKPVHGRLEFL